MARQANLCIVLSSVLLTLYLTLGHQTVELCVNTGLITMM
jgi:hypothetical protein